ncbi:MULTISPECIES: transglycosylase domain-containing protein [Caballeronia]|jgi:membrane peptidoglycan carboxypeptidase|uniref:transglycosylase domain-containing protein n=1 Tax=Caballeronia TaxID=1827195 RepID=UPI001FD22488|nr:MULTISPECIES: transglycosylase domain-containing protein [Caballeronia]MDR5733323.1 transglycosylase domain-containing protein [Caballeronia sp. LZ025]
MSEPLEEELLRASRVTPARRWIAWLFAIASVFICAVAVRMTQIEMQTSQRQAHYLSELGSEIGFSVGDGPSASIPQASAGPYDARLGYALLPSFEERLLARGFAVTAQARGSAAMLSMADQGLFVPYEEKDRAGLTLLDSRGNPLFSASSPGLVYDSFESVPPVIVHALLFIEDRNLLDDSVPNRNPAIDWGRFGRALFDQGLRVIDKHAPQPGGSTLATQIEKFRHSSGGRTASAPEKLRQIASASVRAYLEGPQTMPVRRQLVVRYLNSVPLAARPGIGEINGLPDGMAAWYGRDFDEYNRILNAPVSAEMLDAQALAFKQALSLMIAQRAPSRFLRRGSPELKRRTDSYLRLLGANGIIAPALRDMALAVPLELNPAPHRRADVSFVTRKGVTALRSNLLGILGVPSLYDLDRLDLSVTATLDAPVQRAVSERLASAATRDGAADAGLFGYHMLRPHDDPSKISYSFTLMERKGGTNLVRVQTDSINEPFDISRSGRLNLGSTAKMRTVITYLQIVSALHARYGAMSAAQLRGVTPDRQDVLTRWALDYLAKTPDRSLPAMLDAAVARKYSASAGETFYTGGGAQAFSNFEATDNSRVLTVESAFGHSVNLVFVRLMRDIVHYEMVQVAGPSSDWLDDPAVRHAYLTRFADAESRVYMSRFYGRYRLRTPEEALALLLRDVRKSPPKLATVLRSVAPDEPQAWFDARMREALRGTPSASITDEDLAKLYVKYAVDKFNLNDRGYIASVHPLELWTVNYLRSHTLATVNDVQDASRDARVTAYSWLFKTRYHATQDRRIKRMVELQAYAEITKSWRALGYPFASVTPSYAAAIGASGDRPEALAQLIGIVECGGKGLGTQRILTLEFAKGTPYETRFAQKSAPAKPLLAPEIATVVQRLLRDVVEGGTAKRLADGLALSDGRALDVAGKTGTGDQRFNVYARGRRLIESRKVNRTATFVFVIGERFFGTLTAYVREPYAAHYDFTSALAVQLLKSLGPALRPLLTDGQAVAAAGEAKPETR